MAAIEAIFASVNPFVSQDDHLNQMLTKALDLMALMQKQSSSVRRAFYGSLTKTFDRIRQQGKGDGIDLDANTLKIALFSPDVEVEAVRLLRADAVGAICKSSPKLASRIKGGVVALKDEEKSATVRDR